MTRKKVLIAINCMNVGGAPSVALAELEGLDSIRYEPWLLTLYPSKPANFMAEARAAVGTDHVREFSLRGRSPLDVPTLFRIWRFLREEDFDTVITHLFLANLVIRFLAVLAGVPRIIAFEHSRYEGKRSWQKMADRLLARSTDHIVVAHEEIASFTSAQEGIRRDRFAVIPNPILLPARDEQTVEALRRAWEIPEGVVFLSVGRFSDEKGHLHLIRAAKQALADESRIVVLIVGHGPRKSLLEREAQASGIADRCLVVTDPARARYAYYAADVFVLPSLREGESMATREALIAGLPVIASDLPTLRTIINDSDGTLIPPGDEAALASALIRFARDASFRRSLAAGAVERAASFDPHAHVRELSSLLI